MHRSAIDKLSSRTYYKSTYITTYYVPTNMSLNLNLNICIYIYEFTNIHISEIDSGCVQYRNLKIRDIIDQNIKTQLMRNARKSFVFSNRDAKSKIQLVHDAASPTR